MHHCINRPYPPFVHATDRPTYPRLLSKTQIGAFLTTSAGYVVVGYPSDPDPPFVAISAPDAVGYCDDVVLEGSASFTSLGTRYCGVSNATGRVKRKGLQGTNRSSRKEQNGG